MKVKAVSYTHLDVYKRQAQMGRRIVSRMEQLGMTPVLQGYVGFVPSDFQENVLSLIHI